MSWIVALLIAIVLGVVAVIALLAAFVPAARPLEPAARWGMKGAQVAIALYVFYDILTLLQGHQLDEGMTHAGYAIASVGVPVLLLTRQPGEPDPDDEDQKPVPADPPHLAVVAVAAIATAVLVIRLQQTW